MTLRFTNLYICFNIKQRKKRNHHGEIRTPASRFATQGVNQLSYPDCDKFVTFVYWYERQFPLISLPDLMTCCAYASLIASNVLLVALPDDVKCCKNAAILLILLIPALFTENLEIFFAEDHQQAILYPMSTVFTGQGGPVYDSIASLFAVHRHTHTHTDGLLFYIYRLADLPVVRY